ncbi:hypothetical protein EBH_0081100 [Eimeria brunetti]|uniref:Uncharacterized protein n=1 Tax=Eimeria brunetti TaxID=51314 RepID=U6LI70_9EIME|nr:hypothetical protein EBH_0081100 [Eimeria brunetti]
MEEQSKVGTEAKHLRLEAGNEETQVQSPLPPLDPELDSLIDLVLSEVDDAFAESVWLGDADPLHSTADPSTDSKRPVSGGGSELLHKDIGTLGIAYQLPAQPSKRKERKKDGGVKSPLSADSPDSRTQHRSPVEKGTLHRGPVPHAARLTPKALDALIEGMATASGDPAVDTFPRSSRASPATPLLPSALTVSTESESTEQSASVPQLPTDANVIAHFGWLGNVYTGVPDSVLKTHPFYRYPKTQPAPGTAPFDVHRAATFVNFRIQVSNALAVCREIMGKPDLSRQDFQQLIFHAERLCGYAVKKMPVAFARPKAVEAIETLGVVFLVVDTLHCVAEILGELSMKHVWWPKILRHIEEAGFAPRRDFLVPGMYFRNAEIACTLDAALEYYRQGHRPPVRMVVGLKEALLCEPRDRSKFSGTRWNPWREDAAQWRQSIVPSLTGSE